ncbi:MAG: histidine--tRNA ligase [Candidatus Aenigmatarchaeota archaeon]
MIERPRGTRDLEPDQMESRRKLETLLRREAESFGYREVLTPTFEHVDLFLEKSGPSIVEEIYSFEDKGGRELALRPEFTASVMRMYAGSLKGEPKPLKLYYFGPAFRYERPQSGRYREFWHFGTELIGAETPQADAENIALAYNCIKKTGLDEVSVRISNLQILEGYLKEKGIGRDEREELYHLIDKEEETEDILGQFELEGEFIDLLDASFENIPQYLENPEHHSYLKEVTEYLSFYGIDEEDYVVDLRTVRGLDYYKGVVFEIDAEKLGAEKQICGGGDYDLGDVFNTEVSSKGFAIGFDRLHLAMEQEGKGFERERKGCFIIPIGEEMKKPAYEVLSTLRENDVRTDIDLKERNIGKALGYADKSDFRYCILVGEEEIEKSELALKDMKTGGQKNIKKGNILKVLNDGPEI